tara:strand:- start:988 stop:1266 length:279 start_codon:yes stop_codon:yes gene_type:complete
MVSVAVFASVVGPLCLITIVLLILIIGSRSSISTLRDDIKELKAKQKLQVAKNSEIFEQLNAVSIWSIAAQQIGFLPVPESESKRVYDEIYG